MTSCWAKYKLVIAEQQSSCSDIQARCSGEHWQLGLFTPSQLVAVKTTLTTASVLCLGQTEHKVQKSFYYSHFKLSRWSENLTRYCEYSQRQGHINPSLLVAARITFAAASASCLKQPNTYFKVDITIHRSYLLTAVRSNLTAASAHSLLNNSIIN